MAVVEQPERKYELVKVFLYQKHEVLIAGTAVDMNDTDRRDPAAHITNRANTERLLLEEVPELSHTDNGTLHFQRHLETFLAKTFGRDLYNEMARRVRYHNPQVNETIVPKQEQVRKFALAGLDLMVTADYRILLLEVNISPAPPPEHGATLLRSLADLAVGNPAEHFVAATAVLLDQGAE